MGLSKWQTLAGLLNAMLGGTMLVVPVYSIYAGYLITAITVVAISSVNCYTAYLIVSHMGKATNIKELILNHFNQDRMYLQIYNVVIWVSYLGSMLVYFPLFCLQIQGIFGKWPFQMQTLALFIILQILALRNCQMNDFALSVGLSSVFVFALFLAWAYSVRPEGAKIVEPIGPEPYTFTLAALNTMTIHDYLPQLIVHHKNKSNYTQIIILTYVIGASILLLISYGCFALVNIETDKMTVIGYYEDYDGQSWELTALEIIYIVHILTAFPQYCIFSKARMLSFLGFSQSDDEDQPVGHLEASEIVYTICLVGLCYCFQKANVSIGDILSIFGGGIGLYLSFVWPTWLHLKCLHYDCSSGFINQPDERNLGIQVNPCSCRHTYSSTIVLYMQAAFLLTIAIFGTIFFLRIMPESMDAI